MAENSKLATKSCFKCGADKPLHEFYRHPKMADGRFNKCKECNKRDVRQNRKAKIDYYRTYDKKRGNRQTTEYQQAYKDAFPKKTQARAMVGNAVKGGKLYKPKLCQECGSGGRIHGHHDDYDNPLDVRWLCAACHRQWHVKNGEGKNGG